MIRKGKRYCIILLCFVCVYGAACKQQVMEKNAEEQVIGKLAYEEQMEADNFIYIEEKGIYQPYIVLTNNYNGKTLLLRKYALDEDRVMNDYKAYYENSDIDAYLNNVFLLNINADIRGLIEETEIEILDEACLEQIETDTTLIERKAFLLSYIELGYPENGHVGIEGRKLNYFNDPSHKKVTTETGQSISWWLRSADSTYYSCFYAVGPESQIGSTNAFDKNGIRPAFCVDSKLPITKSDTIIESKTVYIIDI